MKNKDVIIKAKSFLMLFFFFFIVSSSVYAQGKTVSGKIVDDGGEPLPGVTVVVKGSYQGTISDIDGNYSIVDVAEESVLVFSFIGMISQEISVKGRSAINVAMMADAIGLEEVIAVGYGVQKKATLTGSIETVSSEVFQDRAVSNPALALQGQTPGLVVTRSSSQPGKEGLDFQIRGATSVNGGNPLIVIDGSPIINNEAFYRMNTDDIESMSVLKDGSAAVYGSRAANGVILVTTKKGSGEMKVNINSNVRFNTIGIRPPTPSMKGFATVWLEATDQDALYDVANYRGWVDRATLLRLQNNEAGWYTTQNWGEVYMANSPIFDEMYGNSVSHQQNISISGSTDKSNYRFSGGYAEDRGMIQPTYDGKKQMNLRANYDFKINDWFKLETGISYFHSNVSGPSTGLGREAISWDPPFFPAKNDLGQWYANFGAAAGARNAIASVTDGGKDINIEDQLKINLAATFKLQKDLSFRATASVDKAFGDDQSYVVNVLTYGWDGELAKQSINSTSSINQKKTTITYQTYGGFLNYTKELGDHDFGAMLGVSAELRENNSLYGYRQGFDDYGIYDLNIGSTEESVKAEGGAGNWGLYGYVGRFNYAYKSKYLLELSGRRDGSSRFASGYKWSNFANASVGWVISEEDFMSSLEVISFMKLRASYGETGNQIGIDEHDYLSTIRFGSGILGSPAALQNSASVGGLTSATRTWERVANTSVGVDFRLLQSKIFGSFDYYQKKNDGMLISINYPSILGGAAPKSNSGVLETKGWETIVGYRDTKGDLEYNVSFNIGNSTNELVSMEGVSSYNAGNNSTVQGYPLNSYFLYQTEGFFANEDEVSAYYAQAGNGGNIPSATNLGQRLRPGDTKKIDLDNSGAIESTGNIDDMNGDVKYMGDAAPHYNYGINLGLKYKGFDLSAMFQGVFKQNVVRTGHMAQPFFVPWSNQTSAYVGKTWTSENTDADYPRMTNTSNQRSRWNWENNDFMMQNNRYIRLKALVVGYNFNLKNIEKLKGIEKLRLYFSGNDLFEFTSLKDGYDPEYGESTQTIYPFNRTYSFGLDLTF